MSNIAKFRKKIRSAKNIAKITKAMQMVAASKMKKAQESAEKSKVYAEGIYSLATVLAKDIDVSVHPLLASGRREGSDLVVVVSPEKGLCGSLVTNLERKLFELTESGMIDKKAEYILIGKKISSFVRKIGGEIIAQYEPGLNQPGYDMVPPITRLIEDKFISGVLRKVIVVYTEFINTVKQLPNYKIVLPLILTSKMQFEDESRRNSIFTFEPSPDAISDAFLSFYMEVIIYQLILESFASEQSARMIAMKNATDNANSVIEYLTLEYNKTRQSKITSEILDIGNATNMLD